MNIKIYAEEIADGLEKAIRAGSTIAYTSEILERRPSQGEATDAQNKIDNSVIKSLAQNNDQFDLFYLSSVLVSTGWNKNDDVFLPEELWAARKTAEDKQFNFMHNEKDIIGHITDNCVADFNGNEIEDNMEVWFHLRRDEEVPSEFNVVTNAVIYTSWSDPELRERTDKIVAEIKEGNKWFVSMECLFPHFDYSLMNSEGECRIVKREEASAYLTKHLRAYGGSGEYEGYKVGRALRNISFSGKGLVSKPANPRSVILKDSKSTNNSELVEVYASTVIKETNMSDVLQKQITELKSELSEARDRNDAIEKEMEVEKEKAVQSQLESFEATISEKDKSIEELTASSDASNTEVESLNEQIAEAAKLRDEALAKIESMEQKARSDQRRAALADAGVEEDDIEETIASFESLDDEAFDKVIALMKKRSFLHDKKKDKDIEKKEDEDPKVKSKHKSGLPKSQYSLSEDEGAVISDEILDDVEESSDVALAEDASDDETQDLRTTASEWFGSFLKSTSNLQK